LVQQLPQFIQLLLAGAEGPPLGVPGLELRCALQGAVVKLPGALHSFAEQALPKGIEPVHTTK